MRKENITRTKVQETAIVDFITNHGYANISLFAKAVGMERQNVWARIKGKTNPDITMLLRWAKILNADIVDMIRLFYPDDYEEYLN